MFSGLEPLFLKQFRRAESSDTRQAIREDNKDKPTRHHDDKRQKQDDSDLWTDSTTVSVEALRVFLIQFLKDQIQQDATNEEPAASLQPSPQGTTIGNRAANAYQTTAQIQSSQTTEPEIQNEKHNESVESEDVRRINKIIHHLNTLSTRGHRELTIPRSGTFLDSMEKAVLDYLNR